MAFWFLRRICDKVTARHDERSDIYEKQKRAVELHSLPVNLLVNDMIDNGNGVDHVAGGSTNFVATENHFNSGRIAVVVI